MSHEEILPHLLQELKAIGDSFYSPEATRLRGLTMEQRAMAEGGAVARIQAYKRDFSHSLTRVSLKTIREESIIKPWGKIEKGGLAEQEWTEKTVAFTAAVFEKWMNGRKHKGKFELWDNQLYFVLGLVLSKAKYDFGELGTRNRIGQMHTGEAKTFGYALTAAVLALQGNQAFLCEPNYS